MSANAPQFRGAYSGAYAGNVSATLKRELQMRERLRGLGWTLERAPEGGFVAVNGEREMSAPSLEDLLFRAEARDVDVDRSTMSGLVRRIRPAGWPA